VERRDCGNTSRLEAFSDGVLAIAITIMVLDLKAPRGTEWTAPRPLASVFGAYAYVMSFIYVGIYRNNHHNPPHAVDRINGNALLANLHLLFWPSLIPFVTGWMGANAFAPPPPGAVRRRDRPGVRSALAPDRGLRMRRGALVHPRPLIREGVGRGPGVSRLLKRRKRGRTKFSIH
jgi:hypothetical protein